MIQTNSVSFDKKNILTSSTKSILNDGTENTLSTDSFLYDLNENLLKLKNINLKDFNKNNFQIETAFLNTLTKQLIGNDISINLDNKSFNKDNEPRIKGKSIIYDNGLTEINKGIFTTCKKTDKCPPWQLSAEKFNTIQK